MTKKDSLIKGTIILTLAAFTARFLGVIQRVPLKHLLEDSGMATYAIAYNIYFILLTIATAGIPSALSKLISEKTAVQRHDEAQRIFRAAVWFSVAAGILITAAIYAAAPYYAVHMSENPEAALAIRALAPALLLFPLIAIIRGYFLGRQLMMGNGLSQIVEQILRVLTAVGLAYLLLRMGYTHEWAIAGASFGGVMGAVGAFAIMVIFLRRLRRKDAEEKNASPQANTQPQETSLTFGKVYAMIFKISIPITLISLMVPVINFIDTSTAIHLLKGQMGILEATTTLGLLAGRAQPLAGIPIILAVALSQSVVPVIASAFAQKNDRELSRKTSQALRISVLSGLPVVLILAVGARSFNGFLFADTSGSGIIAGLTVASMFQIVMMTSAAILMGLGLMKAPTINVFIGIAVKYSGNLLLSPIFGIYGIILATLLSFMITMALNLWVLKRNVDYVILGRRWPAMLAIMAAAAAVGQGIDWLNRTYVHFAGSLVSYMLQSAIIGMILFALYMVLLIVLKVVSSEDLAALPAPARKLLKRWAKAEPVKVESD